MIAAQPEDASSAAGNGVRYHRSDATAAADSVLVGTRRSLGSGRLKLLSDDHKSRRAVTAQLPLSGGGSRSLRKVCQLAGSISVRG